MMGRAIRLPPAPVSDMGGADYVLEETEEAAALVCSAAAANSVADVRREGGGLEVDGRVREAGGGPREERRDGEDHLDPGGDADRSAATAADVAAGGYQGGRRGGDIYCRASGPRWM
mmetsp:Transcript_9408/g.14241  ORF Transcript_9408/g.14241 Transcript_9408/m.14241 type:complete len:117 (+) Transcript_9408:732-1082(+)